MSIQNEHALKLQQMFLKNLVQDSPSSNDSLTVRTFGDIQAETVRFYLYQDVLEELAFASYYREEPCFAILCGHFSMDDEGAFIEISGFDGLEYISDIGEMYQDVRDAVEQSRRDISRGQMEAGQHVVGLFVGNPGGDALLDAEIARVHLSLFNRPFQLALVIDPDAQKIGVYTRSPHARFHSAAFCVVQHNEATETAVAEDAEEKTENREVAEESEGHQEVSDLVR